MKLFIWTFALFFMGYIMFMGYVLMAEMSKQVKSDTGCQTHYRHRLPAEVICE